MHISPGILALRQSWATARLRGMIALTQTAARSGPRAGAHERDIWRRRDHQFGDIHIHCDIGGSSKARILAKPNWTRPYSRSQSGEVHEGDAGADGIDRFLDSGRG